jgi:hypothetical protein
MRDSRILWFSLVAALLAAACGRPQGNATASPTNPPSSTAESSPTALGAQLDVPDATPVILYHDPANFDQVDGMTWDGARRGKVGSGLAMGGIPNSQGTKYVIGAAIRDRSGHVVASVDSLNTVVFWADDGLRYCGLARTASRDVASSAQLQLVVPGQAAHKVAQVGTFQPASHNGGGPYLVACSIAGDRAVIVQSGGQGLGTRQYWVVQLSTGRVLWTRVPDEEVQLVVSHDGALIAEDGTGRSTVYDPTGKILAHVNGWVNLFSWDGSLAVTSASWLVGPVAVTRWRDGTTVWKGPDGSGYGYWEGVAEPGGSHMALGLRDPEFPQTSGFAPVDLYVVSADGTVGLTVKNTYLITP